MASGNIEYIGEIGDKDKSEFLSGAIVLLVPIGLAGAVRSCHDRSHGLWNPVIAFNRGQCRRSSTTASLDCRRGRQRRRRSRRPARPFVARENRGGRFEERFTARRMAQDYLAVYRGLSDAASPHLRLVADDAPAL